MAKTTYNVARMYENTGECTILRRGLTLEQAHKHCRDPETSSSTCSREENIQHTKRYGRWFDGFEVDKPVKVHVQGGAQWIIHPLDELLEVAKKRIKEFAQDDSAFGQFQWNWWQGYYSAIEEAKRLV